MRGPSAAIPVHGIDTNAGATRGELLTVERVTDDTSHGVPHRHSFTQIVFVQAGSGAILADFTRSDLAPGDIHVLAPGQVHAWADLSGLEATAAMFSERALDRVGPLPDSIRELLLFGAASIATSEPARGRIRTLLRALGEAGSIESGRHLVLALLWECTHARRALPAGVGGGGSSPLAHEFMRLAMHEPRAERTVAACAAALAVTPGYLAEHLAQQVGASPGQLLRVALAREAQRQLSGTELSVSQIADNLGFSAASYFARFFRREVGCSPSEYRQIPHSSQDHGGLS